MNGFPAASSAITLVLLELIAGAIIVSSCQKSYGLSLRPARSWERKTLGIGSLIASLFVRSLNALWRLPIFCGSLWTICRPIFHAGEKQVETPNVDRLAREGLCFCSCHGSGLLSVRHLLQNVPDWNHHHRGGVKLHLQTRQLRSVPTSGPLYLIEL